MRLTLDEIHDTEVRINQKFQADIDHARATGNEQLVRFLAKPQPLDSLVSKALRIQQQNNFRIGYDKYWHGKR